MSAAGSAGTAGRKVARRLPASQRRRVRSWSVTRTLLG